MMIVERDIGRLAKFTFDMGGSGDLLSLALNVPPWEDLHTLSRDEMALSNLYTMQNAPDMLLSLEPEAVSIAAATAKPLVNKPLQDRLVSEAPSLVPDSLPAGMQKTAEALPIGGTATSAPQQ
jgi:hypothetical protein